MSKKIVFKNDLKLQYKFEQTKHFIITQFNVRFKWSKGSASTHGKVPNTEWFNHRLKLFDKFCYPSIVNQTCQNFDWLIFFDAETTDKKLLEKYNRFIPIFVKDYKYWNYKSIVKEIKKLLTPKFKWLMTTRFDCDDSLGRNYIKTMQERFSPGDFILNPVNGITYDIRSGKAYKFSYRCSNPYITTVEKICGKPLKTCFRDNHPAMKKHFRRFIQVQNPKRLWLQIIHDKNLGNKLRGDKRIKITKDVLNNFIMSGEKNDSFS